MAFKLLHDRIAVLAEEVAETTASGLIVTEAAQPILPLDVAVGDRVFYNRFSGQPLEIEGVEYVILSHGEIIGVEAQ